MSEGVVMQRMRREWTVQLEERGGREKEREKETDGQRERKSVRGCKRKKTWTVGGLEYAYKGTKPR